MARTRTAKQVSQLKKNGFEGADMRLGGPRSQTRHLVPWRPGKSDNPAGRRRISDEIRAVLDSEIPDGILFAINQARIKKKEPALAPGTTFREAVAARLVIRALDGDVSAIREVADRDEGRPAQRINVNASESKEIVIRVVEERAEERDLVEVEVQQLTDGAPPDALPG